MLKHEEVRALPDLKRHQYIRKHFPINIASSSLRNRVRGHGINDADYVVQPNIDGGKVKCPAYVAWESIMRRAYDPDHLAQYPWNKGTSVSKDWMRFSTFLSWWKKNNTDGWIVSNSVIDDKKEYSAESCCFIPEWLKAFSRIKASRKVALPTGVGKSGGRFQASCGNPKTGKVEYLGSFRDAASARSAYLSKKLEWALILKIKMDMIDERIYPRVVEIIKE